MASPFAPGDAVQTPFGKGVVREVRNGGRLSIDLQQRTIVIADAEVSPLGPARRTRSASSRDDAAPVDAGAPRQAAAEIDLHGLTVEDALARIDAALNDALLASLPELRIIHGRSGGRIRGALHQRLRAISSVRGFRLDPRNAGVTIVSL